VDLSSRLDANGIGDLELLSEDGRLLLRRGWRDSADGRRSGVLVVLPASEQPTRNTLDRFAHEYSLKDELDSTWAVRPLELLRDRDRTALALADPGGELLSNLLSVPMDVGRFLRLAVSAPFRSTFGGSGSY
jgi:hypothetical protein